MLDHISIGVPDLAAANRFYTAALAPLGYRALYERDTYTGYGATRCEFWLNTTATPIAPDANNGLHISFIAADKPAVDAFHAAALAAGGTDNGPPGPRPHYTAAYYAAFIIDPWGHRIEAHTETP